MKRNYTTLRAFIKRAFWHLWVLLYGVVWTAFGSLTRVRDNFLPEPLKQKLGTLHLIESIPQMGWRGWTIGILILLIFAIVRSAILQIRAVETGHFDAQEELARVKEAALSIGFEIHDVIHHAHIVSQTEWNRDIFLRVSATLSSPRRVEVRYELAVILGGKTVVANWLRDVESWCTWDREIALTPLLRGGSKPRYNIDELSPTLEMGQKIDGWLHFRMAWLPDGEMGKCKLRLLAKSEYGASAHDLLEGSFRVIPGKRIMLPKRISATAPDDAVPTPVSPVSLDS